MSNDLVELVLVATIAYTAGRMSVRSDYRVPTKEELDQYKLTNDEIALAKQQPLQVIASVRKRTGLGLREAKKVVDRYR